MGCDNLNIDIICPLYNAENYIENLNNSLLKQKNVNINKIFYILTQSKDNTEQILKREKIDYQLIKKEEFSHSLVRERKSFESKADILVFIIVTLPLTVYSPVLAGTNMLSPFLISISSPLQLIFPLPSVIIRE